MNVKGTLFFFFLLLMSCKAIGIYQQDQVSPVLGSAKFENPNYITIEADLEGIPARLLFDTGASVTLIRDGNLLASFPEARKIEYGTLITSNQDVVKRQLVLLPMKTPWYDSGSRLVSFVPFNSPPCMGSLSTVGLFGMDAFLKAKMVIDINFDRREITSISDIQISSNEYLSYHNVRSEFKGGSVYIYARINGKERKVLLDTGNTGSLLAGSDDGLFNSESSFKVEGITLKSASGYFQNETTVFPDQVIEIGGESILIQATVNSSYSGINAGVQIVKLFNWVIDFKNKQVYSKRNSLINQQLPYPDYAVHVVDGKVKVASRVSGKTEYNVGETIVSVNDEEVVEENLCQIYYRLLLTQDWKTLNIKTIP